MNWQAFWSAEALYRSKASLYPLRVLGLLAVCLIVLAGWLEQHIHQPALIMAAYLLFYPHLSQLVAYLLRARYSRSVLNQGLLFSDALHLGVLIGLMGFSIVPALLMTAVLLFYVLLRGQPWHAALSGTLLLTGSSAASLLSGTVPVLTTPAFTSFASLTCLLLLLAHTAYSLKKNNEKNNALHRLFSQEREKYSHLAQDLAKYLSPQVWQMTFKSTATSSAPLRTQRKKLTVFFSDIKGFTDLSEEMEPEDLADILNGYLSQMTRIALKHGGTVDKFIGDSIMVFFGDPHSRGAKNDAMAAVSMALEMRRHMNTLRQQWQNKGIHKRLEIRMGINTGYCTVGTFGADSRMDYTIIGREVNLASRLESAANANEILVSGETYTLVKNEIMGMNKGQIQVKGFARPVQIFQVVDYRRDLGPGCSYLSHELPGFSMQLDAGNIGYEDVEQVVAALNQALEQLQE